MYVSIYPTVCTCFTHRDIGGELHENAHLGERGTEVVLSSGGKEIQHEHQKYELGDEEEKEPEKAGTRGSTEASMGRTNKGRVM